jgi:hypothetical protein
MLARQEVKSNIMDISSLHSPLVRRAIAALNDERLDDFMALFAHNAIVIDGPTYHGTEAIRAWMQRENIGVHMRIHVVRERDVEGMIVEIQASSQGGYSGPGTFSFTAHNGLLTRLEIS